MRRRFISSGDFDEAPFWSRYMLSHAHVIRILRLKPVRPEKPCQTYYAFENEKFICKQ